MVAKRKPRIFSRGTCFQHSVANTPATLLPLVKAGARVRIAACNPDSTDDRAAAYLVANGIEVWAWSGMTEDEFQSGIEWAAAEPADAISDMGGELIAATIGAGHVVTGALEATTSGLHRLESLTLPFPVFNWNDTELKNQIHNRHHVGMEVWPVFSAITGLAIHGRSVLVMGFGPVARGVALRAIALGAIVFNVGHGNHEIDIEWLDSRPRTKVRRHVDRHDLETTHLYLLNRASLLNLATDVMPSTEELFDPFSAMMIAGLAWILKGGAVDYASGMHLYPEHLEHEIAERALAARV